MSGLASCFPADLASDPLWAVKFQQGSPQKDPAKGRWISLQGPQQSAKLAFLAKLIIHSSEAEIIISPSCLLFLGCQKKWACKQHHFQVDFETGVV